MPTYCTDDDMVRYRPNILMLGVDSWEEQREQAYADINRVLQARWYRHAAPEMGYDPGITIFDPTLIREDSLTTLATFKSLEYAYMLLKKDGPDPDGFERFEKSFRNRYNEELEMVLAVGLDYDWSDSGTFDDDEVYIRITRRNVRG